MIQNPLYPTAPRPDTFACGIEFQDFVCQQLAKHHIILQNFASQKYQFTVGENLQGFEIKYDQGCSKFHRLSLEIAEKSHASNTRWADSGIMRKDQSWLYIQGNKDVLFIFAKNHLQRWYEQKRPKVDEKFGTIKTFYLDFHDAARIAAKIIELKQGVLEDGITQSRLRIAL
jgi:hypothetical protein